MLRERVLVDVKWDKPGTEVCGTLAAVRKTDFEGKPGLAYKVLDAHGQIVRFFGTTEINSKLLPSDIGCRVRVQFRETKDIGGGRDQKLFFIAVDSDAAGVEPEAPRPANRKPEQPALEITDDDIPF